VRLVWISRRDDAPVAMVDPCLGLAFLAAVFRPPAPSAFCKLARKLFPLAALKVGTLPDPASLFVLPTRVAHDGTRPVLHLVRMMARGKLFDEGKDVYIVRDVFLGLERLRAVLVAHREGGNKVGVLEIIAQVGVFGDVGEELQRAEDVFLARE